MDAVFEFLQKLYDPEQLMEVIRWGGYAMLNAIVFVETGLLIGFFLPGDSLLVTAGVVWHVQGWNPLLLIVTLSLSAIVGDSLGYYIGARTGPRIFTREKSLFFAKDHLLRTQAFYEKHGGKTIILARFIPILRTFAPVVAGVGKMEYRRFLFYNIFGGIGWVTSMVLLGYYLVPVFEAAFGINITAHTEKVIIVVVLLSISPGILAWVRAKFKKQPEPEAVGAAK
jgi:membrane-associated protein